MSIIHHQKCTIVTKDKVEYYFWCGMKRYNDRCDDPTAVSSPSFLPSKNLDADVDLSPEAVRERGSGRHCQRCLKARVHYFGFDQMKRLGYPVDRFKNIK